MMTILEILDGVVDDPDLPIFILGDQDLERKIDRDGGRGDHQGSTSFWITEDNHAGGIHFQTGFFSIVAEMNSRENRETLRLDD